MTAKPQEIPAEDSGPDVASRLEAGRETRAEVKSDKNGGPAKNIVLCSDGTGNRGGKARGTNVWAVYKAVRRQPDGEEDPLPRPQIVFHDDGVGTQKFALFKLLGGAFGWGYSRNIRELYKSLVLTYRPGDSIYLFGFSRGAYTVRGLAGLILNCGILDWRKFGAGEELDKAIAEVFRANRKRYWAKVPGFRGWLHGRFVKGDGKHEHFGRIHDVNGSGEIGTRIRFIGVWDTVDAIGLPIDKLADAIDFVAAYRFRDQELHSNVDRACHAMALDDERRTFWPVMWTERINRKGKEVTDSRIEQVWFSGVHSNVGGGYAKDQMAYVPLDWMMDRAEDNGKGLRFYQDFRAEVRKAANVHGKLYDSRAGLAAYYRYRPRKLKKICHSEDPRVEVPVYRIHCSALRRIAEATADYGPANIPSDPKKVQIVATRQEDGPEAGRLKRAFKNTCDERKEKLKRANLYVGRRRKLYRSFVALSALVGVLAAVLHWNPMNQIVPGPGDVPWFSGLVIKGINFVIPDALVTFLGPLLRYAGVHWVQAAGVLALFALLVFLKIRFERESRHLAVDAWRSFRDKANPSKAVAKVG